MTAGDFCAVVFSSIWALAIWSYFGAAISRIAAVELAVGERVGWGAAASAGARQQMAGLYFAASPVVPMVGVTLIAAADRVLGLLMKWNFFVAIAGAVWPLVRVAAFFMTLLLVGLLLGWPLMWATISVEGTDSFDALSRTYAYVFQKPLRYAAYIAIAVIVGWVGWIVVENFAATVIWLASWAADWGAGPARMDALALKTNADGSWVANGGVSLIAFWNGCVKLLPRWATCSAISASPRRRSIINCVATLMPARPTRFSLTQMRASRGSACRRYRRMPPARRRWRLQRRRLPRPMRTERFRRW